MSNASAASRAATNPKPAVAPDDEPPLPFNHPATVVKALFAKDSDIVWKVPMHLSTRFPFATFGVTTDAKVRTITVTCTLPLVGPTDKEQSTFRLPATRPLLVFVIPADSIEATIAACMVSGVVESELDAIARLVGHRLVEFTTLPRGARPFIERWSAAVRELTSVILDMWWQATALTSNRNAVHSARQAVRARATEVTATWQDDTIKRASE